ncbi:MAG: 3-phosphoshikimate 1-carboxyvinyltransferase [Opitutales bacterium]|nr:3-phosphoshikimate 1-carboxyvinyltransferase [Opitutales bacterium]
MPITSALAGRVALPGSKSLTNRALVMAALAQGAVTIQGALFSRDTELMVAALRNLGFSVEVDADRRQIAVEGRGGRIPRSEASLLVGNAGTVARFLTAMLQVHPAGSFALDGDTPMRQRPMQGLLDTLAGQGARFVFGGETGCFPFQMHTRGLTGGNWSVDASASSQMLSALLMIAPLAGSLVTVSAPGTRPAFVNLTLEQMRQCGIRAEADWETGRFTVYPGTYAVPDGVYKIEPDVTAASYFMALPYVTGGSLTLADLPPKPLQGDARFREVAEAMGLIIQTGSGGWTVRKERGPGGALDFDFETFSDTFLTLAALTPLLPYPTTIRGIGHTRHQETDRVKAMETELGKLGQTVEVTEDTLRVIPRRPVLEEMAMAGKTAIKTYEDHRVAMSFGVLGSADVRGDGQPWLAICDPVCCGKTFPDFFHVLEGLRLRLPAGHRE